MLRRCMFDRFSENAKKLMSRARALATRHRTGHIDVEHILIGILELPASNAKVMLEQQGIDTEMLRSALETMLPRGTSTDEGPLPFTTDAKRTLEQAMRAAAELHDTYIDSQHLLLGILRDPDNDARNVLIRVGADPEVISKAMTAHSSMTEQANVNLLLISNSTMHGGGYLQHCKANMEEFLGEKKRVMFVPFALANHDGYAEKARESFTAMGHELDSIHTYPNKVAALAEADAVFIGGGNTFRLLAALSHHGLLTAIRDRVRNGMPYIGSSAGTNVATLSIRTTNDMPIVQPPSFDALQLVPFQINPHYLDPNPSSSHMGETREERILQFHEEHEVPVLGLREGCMLHVQGAKMQLLGTTDARLFRRAQPAEEFHPPCDLSFLLGA